MPKVVSLKLQELRKRGYNDVEEWLAQKDHLYIGRRMRIFVYTNHKTYEKDGTKVALNVKKEKILIRTHYHHNHQDEKNDTPFDQNLLQCQVGSFVKNQKIVKVVIINESKWHNPFRITDYPTNAISSFETYLKNHPILINSFPELEHYSEIGCWCKPQPCHGDIILQYYYQHMFNLNQKDKNDDHKKSYNDNHDDDHNHSLNSNLKNDDTHNEKNKNMNMNMNMNKNTNRMDNENDDHKKSYNDNDNDHFNNHNVNINRNNNNNNNNKHRNMNGNNNILKYYNYTKSKINQ